jgi:hypothetical protein
MTKQKRGGNMKPSMRWYMALKNMMFKGMADQESHEPRGWQLYCKTRYMRESGNHKRACNEEDNRIGKENMWRERNNKSTELEEKHAMK